MHVFFFFNNRKVLVRETSRVFFSRFYPDKQSYYAAKFLVVASFSVSYSFVALMVAFRPELYAQDIFPMKTEDDDVKDNDVEDTESLEGRSYGPELEILALSYVPDESKYDWGRTRWMAKTMPEQY